MIQPALVRRSILRGAVAAASGGGVGSAGLEGAGMVRLGWVQHLMAGSRALRDYGKNTGRALAARARSRFLAALGMTDRKARIRAKTRATAEAEAKVGAMAEAKAEADSQRE
jgi:hypothetical protein